MLEQWRDIIGYEGYYQVSNLGRVRSVDRHLTCQNGHTRFYCGQVLTLKMSKKSSYKTVGLRKPGVIKTFYVHQLVLKAFIGPRPVGMQGCHENGIPTDNCATNLRWGTLQHNNLNKRDHGTNRGRAVRRSDGVEFQSMCEAAESTQAATPANIWKVCNGRAHTAGSYNWEYIK